jgi:hypothetical protein
MKDVYLGEGLPFPKLSVTDLCAYIKLFATVPGGVSQFFMWNRKVRLLRVLVFGKKDPFHEREKTN